jgi:hypothetical protein
MTPRRKRRQSDDTAGTDTAVAEVAETFGAAVVITETLDEFRYSDPLLDFEQLDLEVERCVGGNAARSAGLTVSQVGGNL